AKLSEALLADDDLTAALQAADAAAALAPAAPRYAIGQALCLQRLGETENAKAAWRRAIGLAPDDVEVHDRYLQFVDEIGDTAARADEFERWRRR
ncbi:MAG: hypothetical protein KDC98_10640, partial [Planctomycetes bacterium]|nr:hypothetical protein [Planctomycetota bacterium]